MNEIDEVTASLARMGLIGPHERPAITSLTGGVSSLIVRADTARGPVCVKRALPQLKVAAQWLAPVERNRAEVAWIRIAAGIEPHSVPQILGEDAEGKAFAMAYLEPGRYPVWKSQLRDGVVQPDTARAVAATIARVHATTAGRQDIARAFAHDAAFHALRLAPYFGAAAEAHPDCAQMLMQLIEVTAHRKLALVHGDVSPKNVLVGPEGPVLLDAECAWYGDPAFDLAFCLTHLLLKCVWRPQHGEGYLACLDAFAGTYLDAVSWEPSQVLEARASRLLAGMLLARVDGKSPVEYLTEEGERARVRAFAKRCVLTPVARVEEIRNAWKSEFVQ